MTNALDFVGLQSEIEMNGTQVLHFLVSFTTPVNALGVFAGKIRHTIFPGSVRASPNGTIGNFTNGTIGSQWYHWLTNGTNCTIGRANGTICITIGTNGLTNGTIGKTMNDIAIPLVPLGNPERTP